jgi:lysozyme
MTTTQSKVPRSTIAAAVAGMALLATPIYTMWEGNKEIPYKDIVGVWTVCSGDTRNVVPGVRQTPKQCAERTQNILVEYGSSVVTMSPGIEKYPYEWAAHTIFSANIGLSAYGKSSIRRLYNEKKYVEACRAMRLYDKAGGRVVLGLVNRRAGEGSRIGEYELCLGGAVAHAHPL